MKNFKKKLLPIIMLLAVALVVFSRLSREDTVQTSYQNLPLIEEESSLEAENTEDSQEVQESPEAEDLQVEEEPLIDEDGVYTTKEDVALYIYTYGKLPHNFITKKEAEKLGWSGGGLDKFMPDGCIGGDRFNNLEGLLPEGHTYTECDIDTLHAKSRGAKRIVFSDDGLIFYTDDHYDSFILLYGEV